MKKAKVKKEEALTAVDSEISKISKVCNIPEVTLIEESEIYKEKLKKIVEQEDKIADLMAQIDELQKNIADTISGKDEAIQVVKYAVSRLTQIKKLS